MRLRRLVPDGDPRQPMLRLVAELEAEIAAGSAGPLAARDVKRFRSFAGPSYCAGDELDVIRAQLAQRMLNERHPVTEKQDPASPARARRTEITRRSRTS